MERAYSLKSYFIMKHSTSRTKKKKESVAVVTPVDSISNTTEVNEERKSKTYRIIPILLKMLLVGSLCTFLLGIGIFSWASFSLFKTFRSEIHAFVSQVENPSIKQTDGRTNIVLLGVGGGDHEAPDLTDTIQIFSFHPDSHVSSLSLPRDIWSDSLKDRINTAYYYGNDQKREGGGLELAKTIIEEVTGLPIHYAIVINFDGFKDMVDLVGGIDVTVEKGFTDTKFPIKGKEEDLCNGDPLFLCRYMTVTFSEGIERMTGERALTYVRSRHATGDEGTDFDRGRRQQEVLRALVERLKTPQEWIAYNSVEQIMNIVEEQVVTDITISDAIGLGIMGIPLYSNTQRIHQISLESQFMHPDDRLYGGRYVLIPVGTDTDLKTYIKKQLEN